MLKSSSNDPPCATFLKSAPSGAFGEISKANSFLTRNFSIQSKVIEGAKLGRELGYPAANVDVIATWKF